MAEETGTGTSATGSADDRPPGPGSTRPAARTSPSERNIPWRLIVLGVVLVYAILFVILNSRRVPVNFVFFEPRVSLIVALVLALLIGFLAGYLFDTMRGRRRGKRA